MIERQSCCVAAAVLRAQCIDICVGTTSVFHQHSLGRARQGTFVCWIKALLPCPSGLRSLSAGNVFSRARH